MIVSRTFAIAVLLGALNLSAQGAKPSSPQAPTNLVAIAVSSSQINLSWKDASSNEQGFRVQRAPSSTGPWAQIASTSANITNYANTGLSASTTYHYRVQSFNKRGASLFSNISSATTQPQVSCTYSLSSSGANAGSGAASGTVNVAATVGCAWTAFSSDTGWLNCSPSSGSGNGVVTWSVTANSSTSQRGGFLTIAGLAFSVTQAGQPCAYTLSPLAITFGAGGGTGVVNVTSATGCAWSANTAYSWIHTTSSGSGNGSVNYTIDSNSTTNQRSGTISVQEQIFTVNQVGQTQDFPPTANLISPAGGSVLSGTTTFSASASDDIGVSKVDFLYDGSILLASDFTSPYSIAYNTTTIPNGTHNFFCKAYDTAGNSTVSSFVSATVNNGVPSTGQLLLTMGFAGTTFSDSVYSRGIAVDGGGNFVVAGYFTGALNCGGGVLTSAGDDDIFLAKYTASGSHIWSKRFGALGTDEAFGVAVDSTGNIYVVGVFYGTFDFGAGNITSVGNADLFVAKFTSAGSCLWSKGFGSSGNEFGLTIAVDKADNVVFSGYYGLFGAGVDFGGGTLPFAGGRDIALVKYSASGAHIWSKAIGGTGSDTPVAVATDNGTNVIVTGQFQNTVNFGGGPLTAVGIDIFVAKYNGSDSSFQWSKRFGDGGNQSVSGTSVDPGDNVVVSGNYSGTLNLGGGPMNAPGGGAAFLAKYSTTGDYVFSKSIGTATLGGPTSSGLAVNSIGELVLIGNVSAGTDFGGGILWGSGGRDPFVVKYSSGGNHIWSKRASPGLSSGVRFGENGNVLMTGRYQETFNFGGNTLTSSANYSGFLVKFGP